MPPPPCDMYQEVGNQQTGQRLVTLSISYNPSANRHVIVISVPLGVLIEKGAVIETSGFTTEPMQIRPLLTAAAAMSKHWRPRR